MAGERAVRLLRQHRVPQRDEAAGQRAGASRQAAVRQDRGRLPEQRQGERGAGRGPVGLHRQEAAHLATQGLSSSDVQGLVKTGES